MAAVAVAVSVSSAVMIVDGSIAMLGGIDNDDDKEHNREQTFVGCNVSE